jgi:hypothetical protein
MKECISCKPINAINMFNTMKEERKGGREEGGKNHT